MFCSACGKPVPDQAAVCLSCGAAVTQQPAKSAKRFCSNCGAEAQANAVVCVKCGVALPTPAGEPGRDFLTTLLLAIFVGWIGVHRFYTGNTGVGIAQLFTLGGCGIWTLVDIILIAAGTYRDGQGRPLVRRP